MTGISESCRYVEIGKDGKATEESAELAISKLGPICVVNRRSKDQPELKELYYLRGILRRRLEGRCYIHHEALQWLEAAFSWGATIHELTEIVKSAYSWSNFVRTIEELIKRFKAAQGAAQ